MAHEARVRFAALTALLAGILGAQEALPPLPVDRQMPTPGELLPLRPLAPEDGKDGAVPIRYWGQDVQETGEGWTMNHGAVESPDLLLLADHIRYNTATSEIQAEGHIRMEGPGLRMRCERLRMDWKRQSGEAWLLDMELPPDWHLVSQKVAFITMKHWDFEKVELSPCPQEQPGWKALVSRLSVDLDSYARIRNLWIWVGDVPTFYFLPWLIYPAKAERTSGLLPLSLAFSGPMGASIQIPYYQVLGPTADLTLSPEYFTKEGTLWGAETRWNPEPTHQGSFTGEFIHQKSDQLNRYEFSFKEIWQREDGWQLAADINRASDALLDADYGQGMTRLGGTPFDSNFYLGKSYPWASLSLAASEQRTYFLSTDSSSPLYNPNFPNSLRRQVLPSLQGSIYPVPVGSSFYFDAGARVGRMTYQLDVVPVSTTGAVLNDTYAWERDDGFARLQGRLGQWGPLRADLEMLGRYTRYSHSLGTSLFDTSNTSNSSDGNLDFTTSPFVVNAPSVDRFLGSGRLQLSGPPIGRTFTDLHLFGYSGEVKHLLAPYVAFTENSRSSAEGVIPHFDEVDSKPGVSNSAAGERSLEFGVKQHFLGRGEDSMPFLDLVRWQISAKYHMEPILLDDGRVLKGWGTMDNVIDVEPSQNLRLSFRRSSDLADSDADQSVTADFKTGDGSKFNVAYYSTGLNRLIPQQRGIQAGGLQRVWSDHVRLEFQANYDFIQHIFAGSQVALAYVTPCVATSLRFSHIGIQIPGSLTKEDRLDLVMTLRSLGDLGKYGF